MGLIPNDIINAVIDRSDIVETIGRYVQLKKAGRNFKALCPFHHEKSPSFVVNPDKQIFHCFGCGAGGNAVGFTMRQEHLGFPEAVRFLADHCGITIPETAGGEADSPSRKLRDEIFKVNELASEYFHELLLTDRGVAANAAREYLKARGVNLETVRQFRLGFAADAWDGLSGHLKKKGISDELMAQAGLVIAREKSQGFYDRFRNRIIFPIFDIQARPVAFGARAMKDEEGAKYINSPETPVYTKGRHLFGLSLTKAAIGKLDQAVVVEGYMDMIMPFVHGVENVAASLGTALTVEQIRLIRRYTPNVVMLFDSDPAGQNAIERSLDLLVEEGMNVRVVTLSEDEDPDSFIRSYGVDAFRQRFEQAQSLFDYKIGRLKAQFDDKSIEGRSKICQQMMATISRHKDEVVKFELTRALSEQFKIPVEVLLKQTAGLKRPEVPVQASPARFTAPAPVSSKRGEEMLLALFLNDPQWVKQAQGKLTPEDFTDGSMRGIIHELWQLAAERDEWSVNDLLTRVSDTAAQAMVTRLLSKEEEFLVEPKQAFADCVERIARERQKFQRQQLVEALRQAEAKGDEAAVERLKQQFNQSLKM